MSNGQTVQDTVHAVSLLFPAALVLLRPLSAGEGHEQYALIHSLPLDECQVRSPLACRAVVTDSAKVLYILISSTQESWIYI